MAAASDTVVCTRGLSKSFGDVHAVRELELDVRRGEIFGFLGPNGAGKTTTIRMLLDFLRPTRGSATVLGGCGADPATRARIGYLPADLRLASNYTGNDVIEFFGALRGGVGRANVDALFERFGVDPDRPIKELSTGNRRKIGIVQAFMHAPELLILDEPTSGLDPLLQHEFQQLLRDVVDAGATVFLSSHVLPEVERVADRVAILRAGELVVVSAMADLQERARQRIDLHVAGDANVALFEDIPGVVDVKASDGLIQVVVEGSVDALLKVAATLTVTRIVSHETDLEDVFLKFYAEDRTP